MFWFFNNLALPKGFNGNINQGVFVSGNKEFASNTSAVVKEAIFTKYRPDIDGLRAIAIIFVVLYHAFPGRLTGGFIGVDIFFVISGFLISQIILKEIKSSTFSLKNFYGRRVKRIFPALILVLLATIFGGWFLLFPGEFRQLGTHVLASTSFSSNFVLWSESGYFDTDAFTKPLLHLWSLAIEEQFYLMWPLILYTMYFRKSGIFLFSLLGLFSFFWNFYITEFSAHSASLAFYWPIFRMWELMLGGALAYFAVNRSYLLNFKRQSRELISFLGMLLIVLGLLVVEYNQPYPGWRSLFPTLGAFFIIAAGSDAFLNRKLLSNKLMVWIGLISFPLYLWHWPLLAYLQIVYRFPPSYIKCIVCLASVILASITYRYIEKPVRAGKVNYPAQYCLGIFVVLAVIGGLIKYNFLCSRQVNQDVESVWTAMHDWYNLQTGFKKINTNTSIASYRKTGVVDKPGVLFIGDSHIEQYASRINFLMSKDKFKYKTSYFLTGPGCPAIPNVATDNPKHRHCRDLFKAIQFVINNQSIDTIVIGGFWHSYFSNKTSSYYKDNGKKYFLNTKKGQELAMKELSKFIAKLTAGDKKIFFILDNPSGPEYNPAFYLKGKRFTHVNIDTDLAKYISVNSQQVALNKKLFDNIKNSKVQILDPASFLCSIGKCRVFSDDGLPLYKDEHHFRSSFAKKINFLDAVVRVNINHDGKIIKNEKTVT